jgi:two-component system OmpR family response regulator
MIQARVAEPLRQILVVDDDRGARERVSAYLGDHGYAVHTASGASAMDAVLASHTIDVVILEAVQRGEDGLSICRRLADAHGPAIIMMSGHCEEVDRVLGLELGADDYLSKSCSPRELLARIRAVMRRLEEARGAVNGRRRTFQFLGFTVDASRREVRTTDGAVIPLTAGEFALLDALLEHPQRVLSRDQLRELVRGAGTDVHQRAVDVQVSRLRRKFRHGGHPEPIRTVRGTGYIFDVEVTRV